jgi:hypothetical protein
MGDYMYFIYRVIKLTPLTTYTINPITMSMFKALSSVEECRQLLAPREFTA